MLPRWIKIVVSGAFLLDKAFERCYTVCVIILQLGGSF